MVPRLPIQTVDSGAGEEALSMRRSGCLWLLVSVTHRELPPGISS